MLTRRSAGLTVLLLALTGGTAQPQRLDLTDPLARDFADLQGVWERPGNDPKAGPDRLVIRRTNVDGKAGSTGFGAQLTGLVRADGVRRMELAFLGKIEVQIPYRFENGTLVLTPEPRNDPLNDLLSELAGQWRRAPR